MLHPPPPTPNIDSRTFAIAAQKSEEDLRSFYLRCTNTSLPISQCLDLRLQEPNWKEIESKIKKAEEESERDEEYPTLPKCKDPLQFLEELLAWLDDRKACNVIKEKDEPVWPWKAGEQKREIRQDAKYISYFLNSFKIAFLDGLCTPRFQYTSENTDTIIIGDELLIKIWMLQEFLKYVGKNEVDDNPWEVRLVSTANGPAVVAHFLSWLVVDDIRRILYIIYNDEKISQGANDEYERIARLETTFLHEIGHAVNHLDWYKEKLKSNSPQDMFFRMGYSKQMQAQWIGVPAWHEFEAWSYALAVRGCIKSTRSWIMRLLEEMDNEWRNP